MLDDEELLISDEIINYLNAKTGRHFNGSTRRTMRMIKERLKSGYTINDFKIVIDNKCIEWMGTSFEKYLRPETLFRVDKFEGYLNEKPNTSEEKPIVLTINGYDELLKMFSKMPYEKYIQTEHWLHFRNEALIYASNKCQLCNKGETILNVHHKTYKNLGRETFNDVIVLCEDCHKLVHGKENRLDVEIATRLHSNNSNSYTSKLDNTSNTVSN